jgi:hypothetical protein
MSWEDLLAYFSKHTLHYCHSSATAIFPLLFNNFLTFTFYSPAVPIRAALYWLHFPSRILQEVLTFTFPSSSFFRQLDFVNYTSKFLALPQAYCIRQNVAHNDRISDVGYKEVFSSHVFEKAYFIFSFRFFFLYPITYLINKKSSVSLSKLIEHQRLSLVFGSISILFKVMSWVWTNANTVTWDKPVAYPPQPFQVHWRRTSSHTLSLESKWALCAIHRWKGSDKKIWTRYTSSSRNV